MAELVRRWLAAYGPADPAHLARWLAAPPAWAARLFETLRADLERVDVDGWAGWVVAGDTDWPAGGPPAGVRLLPYFDAYTVASHPRELVFPGPAGARALTGGQAGNVPVLLVDGVVAGVWHGRRAGGRLAVTVEPLTRLDAAHGRALAAEVDRLGRVAQAAATLTVGRVTTGPHA